MAEKFGVKDVIDPASAKSYVGVAVSIGVLAGVWAYVGQHSDAFALTWVGFIAWATYYAAGAHVRGFATGLLSNASGALWSTLALYLLPKWFDFDLGLPVVVVILAFILCIQAMSPLLGFIPGAFVGAAAYFGASAGYPTLHETLWHVLLALVAGAVFGWVSDLVAREIQAAVDHRPRPRPRLNRAAHV